MDGIANVAKQQQTQVNAHVDSGASQGRVAQPQTKFQSQAVKPQNLVEDVQDASKPRTKINSKAQMDNLVDELNKAMAPMNTGIKFGVDTDDIFYVSVIESETSKMIRRFPAEKAADFLPKMQEVTGMLFDMKG
ncbi:MAG: flagellar protein FlaG [Helicobacteraceae bacterium]|nr:flagellar protein FlaG [Candidatus Sulfurimonas ponti]MBL6973163.1 flagellar protein FlaG [Sulfurimonas sp.]